MNTEELLQQLSPWRKANKRLAWRPIVEDGDSNVTASKFAGMPWLAEGEAYPCCPDCNAPMPLFVQLNLDTVPEELAGRFGSGLLQLFYCTSDNCYDGGSAFDGGKLVRIVQPTEQSQPLAAGEFPSFPAKTIMGWSRLDDYPSYQEHDELGLIYDYDSPYDENFVSTGDTVRIHCPLAGFDQAEFAMNDGEYAPESEEIANAESGDKLAGYPDWNQDMEYPNCPHCDRRMELVFQLDSDDHLPFMFGDAGCGHITQCPDHKTVVTFAWACS